MQYKNGCTSAPGCAGSPTHIYNPQGGFPTGYCITCAPAFLKKTLHTLPTTATYAALTERVMNAVSAEPEPIEEPTPQEPPADQTPEPEHTEPEQTEADAPQPKPKTRRPRRKKTAPAPTQDDTTEDTTEQ